MNITGKFYQMTDILNRHTLWGDHSLFETDNYGGNTAGYSTEGNSYTISITSFDASKSWTGVSSATVLITLQLFITYGKLI